MLCVYILAGMLNLEGYKVAILAIESLLAQVFPRSQGFARRVRYRRLMPIASGAAQTKLQDPSLPSRYSPSQPKWAPPNTLESRAPTWLGSADLIQPEYQELVPELLSVQTVQVRASFLAVQREVECTKTSIDSAWAELESASQKLASAKFAVVSAWESHKRASSIVQDLGYSLEFSPTLSKDVNTVNPIREWFLPKAGQSEPLDGVPTEWASPRTEQIFRGTKRQSLHKPSSASSSSVRLEQGNAGDGQRLDLQDTSQSSVPLPLFSPSNDDGSGGLVYELPDYGKVHAEVYAEEYILVPSSRSKGPRSDGPNLAGGAYAAGSESLPPSFGGPKGKSLSSWKPPSHPDRPPGMPGLMPEGSCFIPEPFANKASDVIEVRRMPEAARPQELVAHRVEPSPDAPEEPPGLSQNEN